MSLLNVQDHWPDDQIALCQFSAYCPTDYAFSSVKNRILLKKCNIVSINHYLLKCMLLKSYLKKYQRNMLLSSSVIHYFSCISSQYVNLKHHAYWTGSGHLSGPKLSSMASSPQCSSSLRRLTKLKEEKNLIYLNKLPLLPNSIAWTQSNIEYK